MHNYSSDSPDRFARFSRTIDFIGADGFAALRRARVAIFGLGGVGSHAAVALARSGIGSLCLIDHDSVDPSNLNRHAVATEVDIGSAKTEVMVRRLAEIAPDTTAEPVEMLLNPEGIDQLLDTGFDFVIDAVDGLNAKVSLLVTCVQRELRVVSSMGASSRADPARLHVDEIEQSHGCPLAKLVRKRLHRRGVERGIIAVYSTEPKRPSLPPDQASEDNATCRVRNRLPSLSTIPGIFGYAAANVVITQLSGLWPEKG